MYFEKSETVGELAKALSHVQSSLRPAIKDSNNPFFKSKYADLNSVWDSCRELLAANELSVTQLPSGDDESVIVTTMLMHSSGEWVSSAVRARPKASDPQAIGSAITYLRRYGLAAVVGIVADEDDDGNASSGNRITGAKDHNRITQAAKPAQTAALPELSNEANRLKEQREILIADIKKLAKAAGLKTVADVKKFIAAELEVDVESGVELAPWLDGIGNYGLEKAKTALVNWIEDRENEHAQAEADQAMQMQAEADAAAYGEAVMADQN